MGHGLCKQSWRPAGTKLPALSSHKIIRQSYAGLFDILNRVGVGKSKETLRIGSEIYARGDGNAGLFQKKLVNCSVSVLTGASVFLSKIVIAKRDLA